MNLCISYQQLSHFIIWYDLLFPVRFLTAESYGPFMMIKAVNAIFELPGSWSGSSPLWASTGLAAIDCFEAGGGTNKWLSSASVCCRPVRAGIATRPRASLSIAGRHQGPGRNFLLPLKLAWRAGSFFHQPQTDGGWGGAVRFGHLPGSAQGWVG